MLDEFTVNSCTILGLNTDRVIAIVGAATGFLGILIAFLTLKWSKRESRASALTEVLEPMLDAAQSILRAKNARESATAIRTAYEGDPNAHDAANAHNQFVSKFESEVEGSEEKFRRVESKLGSRGFRFPDRTKRTLKSMMAALSEAGRLATEGHCARADLELAKFRDQYKYVAKTARGWRLYDPIEGVKGRFRKSREDVKERAEFEMDEAEMNAVLELVYKRATTQAKNTFVIHPPQKLIDRPDIADSDQVIDELKDSVFSVVFQDGTSRMLAFHELIVFCYQLIVLSTHMQELNSMVAAVPSDRPRRFGLNLQFSIDQLMQPEIVKVLLSSMSSRQLQAIHHLSPPSFPPPTPHTSQTNTQTVVVHLQTASFYNTCRLLGRAGCGPCGAGRAW